MVGSPAPFEAALFDVEGTLVDCVPLQLESWRSVLAAAGFSFTHADLQPYSGMDGTWMLERLLPTQTRQTRQELLKAQGELYRSEYLPRVQPFPGVRELFETLKEAGILLGVATTCQKDELATYDKLLRVLELTDAVACGEMVSHGKPDPSLIEACLVQLTCSDRSRVTMIGDTPYDATAATQLGVKAVGLLTGGFPSMTLQKSGCVAIFSQVREVGTLWQRLSKPVLRPAC
jgi:phosphoglycolate phosphatase-like HAD superfamily hydrolase